MPPKLSAVINVGSTFIRLIVAEFPEGQDMRVVEQAVKFMGLGKEVYTTGLIRKRTISQAIAMTIPTRNRLPPG